MQGRLGWCTTARPEAAHAHNHRPRITGLGPPSRACLRPTAPEPHEDETSMTRHIREQAKLITAQLLSGAGIASGYAVGGLLAEEITGQTAMAGFAQMSVILGAGLIAYPLAVLARRSGRRKALTLGFGIGTLGAVVVLIGVALQFLPLFMLGMMMCGSSTASGLQVRYAAVDLADPAAAGPALGLARPHRRRPPLPPAVHARDDDVRILDRLRPAGSLRRRRSGRSRRSRTGDVTGGVGDHRRISARAQLHRTRGPPRRDPGHERPGRSLSHLDGRLRPRHALRLDPDEDDHRGHRSARRRRGRG